MAYDTASFPSGGAEHWKIFGDRRMRRSERNVRAQTCQFVAVFREVLGGWGDLAGLLR